MPTARGENGEEITAPLLTLCREVLGREGRAKIILLMDLPRGRPTSKAPKVPVMLLQIGPHCSGRTRTIPMPVVRITPTAPIGRGSGISKTLSKAGRGERIAP